MKEVEKLLTTGFIREVYYPKWLACPKDSFPHRRIDQLVESTIVHELLTFMDAFLGYNQILMKVED